MHEHTSAHHEHKYFNCIRVSHTLNIHILIDLKIYIEDKYDNHAHIVAGKTSD